MLDEVAEPSLTWVGASPDREAHEWERDDARFDTLRFKVKDGVAWVRLNRPDKLNAFTLEMWDELRTLGRELLDDPGDLRVLVVIGEGRAFSSGIDTSVFAERARRRPVWATDEPPRHDDPVDGRDPDRAGGVHLAREAPFATIAAVRGYALGAGLQLALACDIRVVVAGTRVGLLELKYGILPDLGGTQRLPRLVGAGKAKELICTAARIDADEAYRIGLVERLVDDEELGETRRRARGHDRRAAAARGPRREAGGRRRVDGRSVRDGLVRRGRGPGRVPRVGRHPRGDRRVRRERPPRRTTRS